MKTQVVDVDAAQPNTLMEAEVPMLDPHELLNWLWTTQRVVIEDREIQCLASSVHFYY